MDDGFQDRKVAPFFYVVSKKVSKETRNVMNSDGNENRVDLRYEGQV
jgi:hypothetical protein